MSEIVHPRLGSENTLRLSATDELAVKLLMLHSLSASPRLEPADRRHMLNLPTSEVWRVRAGTHDDSILFRTRTMPVFYETDLLDERGGPPQIVLLQTAYSIKDVPDSREIWRDYIGIGVDVETEAAYVFNPANGRVLDASKAQDMDDIDAILGVVEARLLQVQAESVVAYADKQVYTAEVYERARVLSPVDSGGCTMRDAYLKVEASLDHASMTPRS